MAHDNIMRVNMTSYMSHMIDILKLEFTFGSPIQFPQIFSYFRHIRSVKNE